MTLRLPYPPTTNHAYTVARGRKIKTQAARGYGMEATARCLEQIGAPQQACKRRGWDSNTRLAVTVSVCPPDRRRRDLANTEKLALDAVFSWLGLDDSQIDDLHLRRGEPAKGGQLIVTIESLS